MSEAEFEGSIILEKISELGHLEEFYNAIDSDDLSVINKLMEIAGFDQLTTEWLIKKLKSGE